MMLKMFWNTQGSLLAITRSGLQVWLFQWVIVCFLAACISTCARHVRVQDLGRA
jgi:hypothetical protein